MGEQAFLRNFWLRHVISGRLGGVKRLAVTPTKNQIERIDSIRERTNQFLIVYAANKEGKRFRKKVRKEAEWFAEFRSETSLHEAILDCFTTNIIRIYTDDFDNTYINIRI